jgi:HK97 gp10 family phage protein
VTFQPDEAGLKAFLADLAAEALRPAADAVAEAAKARAPRRTGKMADSIHAERTGPAEYKVSWDKDHWYGVFSEVGTEKEAARPFLRPALDSIGGRVAQADEEG